MSSASFRVKEFGFGERLQYPIRITWENGEEVEEYNRPSAVQTLTGQGHYVIPEAEGGGLQTFSASPGQSSWCYIIPAGAETDTIRKFSFLRTSSSFSVKASYADLPPGAPQAQLGPCPQTTSRGMCLFRTSFFPSCFACAPRQNKAGRASSPYKAPPFGRGGACVCGVLEVSAVLPLLLCRGRLQT